MTDMQRWASPIGEMTEAVNGKYVLAADAKAVIAAAERKGGPEHIGAMLNRAYEEGFESGERDMLAKCIAVVDALDVCRYVDDYCQSLHHGILNDVYFALRGLEEKP